MSDRFLGQLARVTKVTPGDIKVVIGKDYTKVVALSADLRWIVTITMPTIGYRLVKDWLRVTIVDTEEDGITPNATFSLGSQCGISASCKDWFRGLITQLGIEIVSLEKAYEIECSGGLSAPMKVGATPDERAKKFEVAFVAGCIEIIPSGEGIDYGFGNGVDTIIISGDKVTFDRDYTKGEFKARFPELWVYLSGYVD